MMEETLCLHFLRIAFDAPIEKFDDVLCKNGAVIRTQYFPEIHIKDGEVTLWDVALALDICLEEYGGDHRFFELFKVDDNVINVTLGS